VKELEIGLGALGTSATAARIAASAIFPGRTGAVARPAGFRRALRAFRTLRTLVSHLDIVPLRQQRYGKIFDTKRHDGSREKDELRR